MKKTAVVTGANRGIGLALCEELSKQDYRIIAICRRGSAELAKLDAEIIENIDVSDFAAVNTLQQKINEPISLLIHNAGIGLDDNINTLDFGDIQRHFLINACGPLAITQSLLGQLDQGSKIALISSRLGSIGKNCSGGSYGYRMAKAALNMAGKNLSLDLKKYGIAVAILSPGMTDTDMLRALGVNTGANVNHVAKRLLALIDGLNLENTGTFWHVDTKILPW